ncbi:hypothetical protein Taro_042881 [Colocasia esculenta]|uniref:Uncharacterized protein n=1 Tax=Colocasia esculenta TaxID=4460 RepID=A0A843WJH5_COLES|nr:hypothetical protein [Colocasia esculenta]
MKVLTLLFLVALVVSPTETSMMLAHRRRAAAAGEGEREAVNEAIRGVDRVSPFAPPAPKSNENHDDPPGF